MDPISEDRFDVNFASGAWPHWRKWHKDVDVLLMKELLQIYSIRAWCLQWFPPRFVHWLIVGK